MNQIEGVISIKDLFAELVRKCWLIILCAVLMAAVLGGYKLVNNLQAQKNVDEVVGELTEEEIETAQDYILKAREQEKLDAYIEDSILLNINPYNVYRTELQFIINGATDEEDLSTLRAAYADYALFGRLASDIAKEYGDYDELALKDVIETDGDIREQDPALRTIRIMVLAKDEAQAEELAACVKEQVEAYAKELNESIGKHELELLDENTFHFFKSDLVGKKDYYKEQLENLETEVEMLEDQLNASQMSYALDILGEDVEDSEDAGNTAKPSIGIKSILKFAILGGALGFAGSVALIVAWYFFSSQIKSEKETEYVYQIAHLGNACVYKRNKLDILADNLFDKEKQTDLEENLTAIVNKIASLCKEKSISQIAVVGTRDEETEQVVHSIVQKLAEERITVLLPKKEEIEKASLPKNIILTQRIGKTTGEEINEQMNFCKDRNLEICGYITFSK